MTRKSKYIIGMAALISMVSFFLPSRLTSNDWGTIISFAKTGNIGFAPYILLLFPITFGLILTRKLTAAFIVSTMLLLTNTTLFENLLGFIFYVHDTFQHALYRATPFLIYSAIFTGLIYKAFKKDSWVWYGAFIWLMVVSYIWFNNNNCTIIFISDLGIRTSNFRIWFQNCGTYYAWWTASLLLNIGLFNEMKNAAAIGKNTFFKFPISNFQFPIFNIQYRISNIQYLISNIQYPTSLPAGRFPISSFQYSNIPLFQHFISPAQPQPQP